MRKSKLQYEREKNRILKLKISELERSSLLFNNWQDYIFGEIPEETKNQNLSTHINEMIFVRI